MSEKKHHNHKDDEVDTLKAKEPETSETSETVNTETEPGELELLRQKLDAAKAKSAENLDGWQRAVAEFQNYKKRMDSVRDGVAAAKWLVDQKILPDTILHTIYGSYVAGIFRTLRFGTGEAHGRAEMMEFNYLQEKGALRQGADGRYTIDYEVMPAAIASLTEKLLTFEAQGDRAGVEAWYVKYDVMPSSLTKVLETTKDILVDITPEFELSRGAKTCCGTPALLTLHHHDAAHRVPENLAEPARPVGGAADRNARPARRQEPTRPLPATSV